MKTNRSTPTHLTAKNVVLTGATGGIGRALAEQLASAGARLVLVGRNAAALETLSRELPGNHVSLAADLTEAEGLQRLVSYCDRLREIDVLINCVGVNDFTLFEQQSPANIQCLLNTNLLAPMLVCRALIPLLRQRPAATIFNVGSNFGSIGFPGYASYCASKFGLRGFTEALRRELYDTTICVHYLSPRAVDTPMNSPRTMAMNKALKNAADSPAQVAAAAMSQLLSRRGHDRYMGWPERLFVKLNGILPALVGRGIAGQLGTIRSFAATDLEATSTHSHRSTQRVNPEVPTNVSL